MNMRKNNDLVEERARFVYESARLAALAAGAPIIPALWAKREKSFKEQFRKIIIKQCGKNRSKSPKELHDFWVQAYLDCGWKYGKKYSQRNKTHPDLVPYHKLNKLEQDKDAVFFMLGEIARQWVCERR